MGIEERISDLSGCISRAASRAGRNPDGIRVLFATKRSSAARIAELAKLRSPLIIGENRVQDAEEKFSELRELLPPARFSSIEKHFIGTLQQNKAKKAVALFDCVQSVDSLSLAEKLSRHAQKASKTIGIFIEVNNGEGSKGGVRREELNSLITAVRALPALQLEGLMGMGVEGDTNASRAFFRLLRREADRHHLQCSMGMSDDFEIAIEEGADMIRIGRAMFGK